MGKCSMRPNKIEGKLMDRQSNDKVNVHINFRTFAEKQIR